VDEEQLRLGRKENQKGIGHRQHGHGKGKTTAAIGVMFRAWGRGLRVCMIQFIKAETGNWGEVRAARKLGIEWHSMGDGFTWLSKDIDASADKARHAWKAAQDKIVSGDYNLVILDEMTYAFHNNWLDVNQVIAWLRENKPPMLTSSSPVAMLRSLIDFADLVTEMTKIKHPFDEGILAQAGVNSDSPP
jgi:cob(I)alamin adenosyltransferase